MAAVRDAVRAAGGRRRGEKDQDPPDLQRPQVRLGSRKPCRRDEGRLRADGGHVGAQADAEGREDGEELLREDVVARRVESYIVGSLFYLSHPSVLSVPSICPLVLCLELLCLVYQRVVRPPRYVNISIRLLLPL